MLAPGLRAAVTTGLGGGGGGWEEPRGSRLKQQTSSFRCCPSLVWDTPQAHGSFQCVSSKGRGHPQSPLIRFSLPPHPSKGIKTPQVPLKQPRFWGLQKISLSSCSGETEDWGSVLKHTERPALSSGSLDLGRAETPLRDQAAAAARGHPP